jgi:serine/threonine protein kinase
MGNTSSNSKDKLPFGAKTWHQSIAAKPHTMPHIENGYPKDLQIDQGPFKKGGFGSVHAGKVGHNQKPVAIKKQQNYLESDSNSKKAFFLINELIALKIVSENNGGSHNCITCESFFKADGFIFMVLPLCVASFVVFKNLSFSNERSRLVLDFVFEIIEALKFIHGLGIVHRDIKAENILIKAQNGKCSAIVADFGSCQLKNISYDRNDGTLLYLPPEFFKPNAECCKKFEMAENSILRYNNCQMDYWALGVLMYYIMTGRFPFIDESDCATHINIKWIMWCYGPGNKMGPKEPIFDRDETGKKIKSSSMIDFPMIDSPRINLSLFENRIMIKILYGFLSPQCYYRWGSRQADNIKRELPDVDEDIIRAAHVSFLGKIKHLSM